MKEINLFKSADGRWLTNAEILRLLEKIGAPDCKILYAHTELSFGLPNPEFGKNDLLQFLFEILSELNIPSLCLPTYTFSFCNKEDYDVQNSRTKMGILNEYIRKQKDAIRSIDPLMSVVLVGADKDLVENLGHYSIGKGSTFDRIHNKEGVKFLFFGARAGACFTYMHYMEERAKVPYRYNREFTGKIIDGGRVYEDTYTLFVRYRNVKAGDGSFKYEDLLFRRGLLKKVACGNSFISCMAEPDAFEVYNELLRREPDYFLEKPFSPDEKDTEFIVHNMVAL
jgi:aminoglycoside 3-N-acetyltransferase